LPLIRLPKFRDSRIFRPCVGAQTLNATFLLEEPAGGNEHPWNFKGNMVKVQTRPWNSPAHLRTDAEISAYIDAALELAGNDSKCIAHALAVVARAREIRKDAQQESRRRRLSSCSNGAIPHEVMQLTLENDWSIIRAWREYLGITPNEMAARLGIRPASYLVMEALESKLRRPSKQKIADVLGILYDQLDV
jgi:DNA-binding phage protein